MYKMLPIKCPFQNILYFISAVDGPLLYSFDLLDYLLHLKPLFYGKSKQKLKSTHSIGNKKNYDGFWYFRQGYNFEIITEHIRLTPHGTNFQKSVWTLKIALFMQVRVIISFTQSLNWHKNCKYIFDLQNCFCLISFHRLGNILYTQHQYRHNTLYFHKTTQQWARSGPLRCEVGVPVRVNFEQLMEQYFCI